MVVMKFDFPHPLVLESGQDREVLQTVVRRIEPGVTRGMPEKLLTMTTKRRVAVAPATHALAWLFVRSDVVPGFEVVADEKQDVSSTSTPPPFSGEPAAYGKEIGRQPEVKASSQHGVNRGSRHLTVTVPESL